MTLTFNPRRAMVMTHIHTQTPEIFDTRKLESTTTRHELRKLLQVPVGVSEGLLHGDGTAQGDERHTEGSRPGPMYSTPGT